MGTMCSVGGGFAFYNVFQHRAVRADAIAGMGLVPHEVHPFPSIEPHLYTSLGQYEEEPSHSKLIRFGLPHAYDPIMLAGVSTVTVETVSDRQRKHYFPMYSEERRGYFDLLVWNKDRDTTLYRDHKVGDDVVVRSGEVVMEYPTGQYSNVLLFIDPTGIPPAFQLLDEIRCIEDKPPNVHVMYFKPPGWSNNTPLDNRFERMLDVYRKKAMTDAHIEYVTAGQQECVAQALRTLPADTYVVGMLSEGAMASLKREHLATQAEAKREGKKMSAVRGMNKFMFLTTK